MISVLTEIIFFIVRFANYLSICYTSLNNYKILSMTNFITVESEYNQIKMKNLLNTGVLIGFIWLVFHFTIIFFFGMVLQSVLLVGIFLAVGNAVALLVDIPV